MFKIGDTISCRIKSTVIVKPYTDYDEIKNFVIIAVNSSDEYGYYLFVPHYLILLDSFIVNHHHTKVVGIDKKYLGENAIFIEETIVAGIVSVKDGLSCKSCNDYCAYSEGNQKDGTLLCYSCRQNPYITSNAK